MAKLTAHSPPPTIDTVTSSESLPHWPASASTRSVAPEPGMVTSANVRSPSGSVRPVRVATTAPSASLTVSVTCAALNVDWTTTSCWTPSAPGSLSATIGPWGDEMITRLST